MWRSPSRTVFEEAFEGCPLKSSVGCSHFREQTEGLPACRPCSWRVAWLGRVQCKLPVPPVFGLSRCHRPAGMITYFSMQRPRASYVALFLVWLLSETPLSTQQFGLAALTHMVESFTTFPSPSPRPAARCLLVCSVSSCASRSRHLLLGRGLVLKGRPSSNTGPQRKTRHMRIMHGTLGRENHISKSWLTTKSRRPCSRAYRVFRGGRDGHKPNA